MPAFYSGKDGNVAVGATDWRLSSWDLEFNVDILDVTNFESSGAKENIEGLKSAKISAKGPYYTGGMAMTAGTAYTITLTVGGAITFSASFRIGTIKITEDVDGVAMVEFTGESNGSVTAAIT